MTTVKQLLQKKGNDVWTVKPQATAYEALQIMAEKNVGALLVEEGDHLVGIFSERDYARKVNEEEKSSKGTKVCDLMSENVLYVSPDKTIDECMALMSAKHIRHLPVIDGDTLVGIVTIGDVVKEVISTKNFEITELENYISGRLYGVQ